MDRDQEGINRRDFLRYAGGFALGFSALSLVQGCTSMAGNADHAPFNVLFLMTDQQRFDTLATYGNNKLKMPNLNKLAEHSVVFERTYVTEAICTPSRSSIMTGYYPHNTGCIKNNIHIPKSMPCLPELLPKGEYRTGYFGKWHLGDEVFNQHGFDQWVATEDEYTPWYSEGKDRDARSSYHHFLMKSGCEPDSKDKTFSRDFAAKLPEQFGKPAFTANEACQFIRDCTNQHKPFVAYVSFLEPHNPYFGPRDDQYKPDEVSLPPNFNDLPGKNQSLNAQRRASKTSKKGFKGTPLANEADWRKLIARYWGLCSLTDTYFGKVLDTLKQSGAYNNTIIIFTSDHGDMMGSHRLITKNTPFEESSRVCFLMHLPGQTKQKQIDMPVSNVDILPTMLDYMGFSSRIPGNLDGESLRPIIEGKERGRDVFMEWTNARGGRQQIRSIVTPDLWKFNYADTKAELELYNLQRDPNETNNLAFDQQYLPLMQKLAAKIREWQRRTGDTAELPPVTSLLKA